MSLFVLLNIFRSDKDQGTWALQINMLPPCYILNHTILRCRKVAGFWQTENKSLRQRKKGGVWKLKPLRKGDKNRAIVACIFCKVWRASCASADYCGDYYWHPPVIFRVVRIGLPSRQLATMDTIVHLTARVSLDGGGAGVLLPHLSSAGRTVSSQQKQIMAITMKKRARSVTNQNKFYLFGPNGFHSGWPSYYFQ